jgi:hypothetical protein
MDKEEAEQIAKTYGEFVEKKTLEFLLKEPLEKLEIIRDNLLFYSPISALVQDVLEHWEELKGDSFYDHRWMVAENKLWYRTKYRLAYGVPKVLCFSVLEVLLSEKNSPLPKKFRSEMLDKHQVTTKKFQNEFWEILSQLFDEKVRHGGSKGQLDHQAELVFRATYNRYLFVIRNARKEKKRLKKTKKTDLAAKREAMEKYGIPEDLIDSTFSDDRPSDVALYWAKEFVNTDLEDSSLRNLLNQEGKKPNIDKTITMIDIDFSHGTRIYGVTRDQKEKIENLKFHPLQKPKDQEFGDEPDNFLVSINVE